MEPEKLKQILEASLMVTDTPLSFDRLANLFKDEEEPPTREKIRRVLEELEVDYENAGVELVEVASGYRFQARKEVAPWVNRLFDERRPKYSRALLETIAIIAYRQPITRGEIEGIRGVAVSTGIIRTLLEREWVRVVGHRDVPGKPAVYATTKAFLDYFNLSSIGDLPSLAELKDFEDPNADLFEDQQSSEGSAETESDDASDDDEAREASDADNNDDTGDAGTDVEDNDTNGELAAESLDEFETDVEAVFNGDQPESSDPSSVVENPDDARSEEIADADAISATGQ